MPLTVPQKLAILADAAKYDASCASSGGVKRNSKGGGIGSVTGAGICHSYTPDGRCVSLLKVLLTNFCIYDCAFCINRRSSDVKRARFEVAEVVALTLDFYKRNYIEGLFLSSGIIRNEDYTMEELVRVARTLRRKHLYRGYLHLKVIPGASPELLAEAGRYADRLSVNVELPRETSLRAFAPEKDTVAIKSAMGKLKLAMEAAQDAKARAQPEPFAAAGQSTQMIVGADDALDADVLASSAALYGGYGLKRVYYSAFSPIPASSAALPSKPPPLQREHRLYQADWMMRYYGFEAKEIVVSADGMLDLGVDPKLAWALANRDRFPVDVNTGEREALLRVPGLGVRAIDRILEARKHKSLRLDDVARLTRSVRSARAFLVAADWTPARLLERESLRQVVAPPAPRQLDLFAA